MNLCIVTVLGVVAAGPLLAAHAVAADTATAQDRARRVRVAEGSAGGGSAPGTAGAPATGAGAPSSATAPPAPSAAAPSPTLPAATAQTSPPGGTAPAQGATPGDSPGGVASGLLECRGAFAAAYGFGSRREVKCEYRAIAGPNHYYTGTLERIGLDLGVSDQGSMLWAVVASTPHLAPGALAGKYVGMSSGISLGPGFSANILMSQDASRQITLQPLSVSSDSGISVSLAGATLTLVPSAPLPQ